MYKGNVILIIVSAILLRQHFDREMFKVWIL